MDKLARNLADTRFFIAGRSASLSSQIVAQVRDDLFEKRLKPGDFLGTEKELAARYGVSRMVARDALRTLSALGIVEIRMGKGGGARIAPGNPRLFAEAIAVQLDLTGVTAAEILDAQRAIECMGAELAALNATAADHARLRALLADAEATIGDNEAFTRTSARVPSGGRRSLAQPRARDTVPVAASHLLAARNRTLTARRSPAACSTCTRSSRS